MQAVHVILSSWESCWQHDGVGVERISCAQNNPACPCNGLCFCAAPLSASLRPPSRERSEEFEEDAYLHSGTAVAVGWIAAIVCAVKDDADATSGLYLTASSAIAVDC